MRQLAEFFTGIFDALARLSFAQLLLISATGAVIMLIGIILMRSGAPR